LVRVAAGGREARGTRPLARREAGLVRQAGLRAFEWILGGSRLYPLPATLGAVGAGLNPADAGSTRLPLRGQRRNSTGFPFSRASRGIT